MPPLSIQQDVGQFWHEKLPYMRLPQEPTLPDKELVIESMASTHEELSEIFEGFAMQDIAKVADGIVDTIYTLCGMAIMCGINLGPLWAEVHASNMEKMPAAPNTKGRKQADGSSMKPKDWLPPRILQLLHLQTMRPHTNLLLDTMYIPTASRYVHPNSENPAEGARLVHAMCKVHGHSHHYEVLDTESLAHYVIYTDCKTRGCTSHAYLGKGLCPK